MERKQSPPRKRAKKDTSVEVRLCAEEKTAFQEAASIGGLPLSTWVRQNLRRAAARELEEAGKVAAFLIPRK